LAPAQGLVVVALSILFSSVLFAAMALDLALLEDHRILTQSFVAP